MKISQKICTILIIAALFGLAGCGGGGGGPTGPANPPQLTAYRVQNEQPVHPGATIVMEIDFIDPSAGMNDGIAYITYSEGTYQSMVSNAPGTSGTLLISFDLSPLVKPGPILVEVWIQNRYDNSSNTIQVPLNVA